MYERAHLLMRMSKNFLALLIAALISSAAPAQATEIPPTFEFTGNGYGHGVGMSQIGAKARAVSGESATAILNYYYKDVLIAPYADTHTIRVNIAHLVKSVAFTTHSPGARIEVFEGDIGNSIQSLPITTFATKKKATFTSAALSKQKALTLRWVGENPIITMTQGSVSTKYKYGYITLKVVKGAMEVTNTLALRDEYLWGISEVPSSWPAAMLEAQAIASRSYALSKLSIVRPSCDCQVYSHITDQNFVGYSKESEPRFGQLWKDAVSRTIVDTSTSLVVLSNGKPAQTYFFSSSGGATQTTRDAWGEATAFTQSVPDSASVDVKLNPRFASWKASSTQELVAKAFLLPNVVSLEILSRNQAGAVTYISATSSEGVTKKIRGDTFRSRAKLPSPWFWLVSVEN
jgi:stage II sporulation protein D